MNITFFIGNGFDINLGLRTQYSNFYPYFLGHARNDNMIKQWIDGNEINWSDLEEKLGEAIAQVKEEDKEQFYSDKEELDRLLIEYLEREQDRYSFTDSTEVKEVFTNSMLHFCDGISAQDIDSINDTMETYSRQEIKYRYVSFNYTKVLDRMVELYRQDSVITKHSSSLGDKNNYIDKVIHIHGTTDEQMILGVNDESQINNDFFKSDSIFLDTFIKKRMNSGIGERKTEHVIDIINESHIICVFGMSIGNTDKLWWEILIDWLISNDNNKLIIYWKGFEDDLKKKLPSKVIRLSESVKRKVFEKGKREHTEKEYDDIKQRIIVSFNSNIFSFPKVEQE